VTAATRGGAEAADRATPGGRILRHRLVDRLFHWASAIAVLTLLGTGFLPILGWRFSWVTPHWIAGLVLLVLVLLHIVRALLFQSPRAMWVDRRDVGDSFGRLRWMLGRGPRPGKPGKYMPAQKAFHHVMALVLITTLITGVMMMVRIDTPVFTRNPYWLSDYQWGVVYVLHGLAALAVITLVMLHVYFAVRPEKVAFLRSMLLGWIRPGEYRAHHDPARWQVEGAGGGESPRARAGGEGG
jgi:formate dehydrogenase subunit gamma